MVVKFSNYYIQNKTKLYHMADHKDTKKDTKLTWDKNKTSNLYYRYIFCVTEPEK